MSESKKVSKESTKENNRSRLERLIKEYNDLEDSAYEKFKEIFYVLKSGKSFRQLYLKGGGILTNCWNSDDRLDGILHLNRYARGIEKYTVSDPKSLGFEDSEGS